jgi:hypothetical protein
MLFQLRTANKLLHTLGTEVMVTAGLGWDVDVEIILTPVRVPPDYAMFLIRDRVALDQVCTLHRLYVVLYSTI